MKLLSFALDQSTAVGMTCETTFDPLVAATLVVVTAIAEMRIGGCRTDVVAMPPPKYFLVVALFPSSAKRTPSWTENHARSEVPH
jgi:hypothetical protein